MHGFKYTQMPRNNAICAIMDLGEDIFDYHMVYVALSRMKSFQGLYIKKFHRGAIRVNPEGIGVFSESKLL